MTDQDVSHDTRPAFCGVSDTIALTQDEKFLYTLRASMCELRRTDALSDPNIVLRNCHIGSSVYLAHRKCPPIAIVGVSIVDRLICDRDATTVYDTAFHLISSMDLREYLKPSTMNSAPVKMLTVDGHFTGTIGMSFRAFAQLARTSVDTLGWKSIAVLQHTLVDSGTARSTDTVSRYRDFESRSR